MAGALALAASATTRPLGGSGRRKWLLALLVAGGAGVLAGALLDRGSPWPSAQVARGSEEAFASGLHVRQFRQTRPFRWTRAVSQFRFRRLPPGPATLEIRLRRHTRPVMVLANNRVLGAMEPGTELARYRLEVGADSQLRVVLRARGGRSPDGRQVGALLERVRLRHAPPARLLRGVVLPFAALGLAAAGVAALAGLSPIGGAAVGALVPALLALALWPCGLLRSPYADQLFALAGLGLGLGAAFARICEARQRGAGPWALGAWLFSFAALGVVATSPMLVTTDATFHANNLRRVASGELFLLSKTPHQPSFTIPYGSLFYAALVPFHHAGLDAVLLVRRGAALAGLAASAGLFLALARRSAPLAGLTVMALQLLPVTLTYYSSGAVSTVVGQALITGFFAWWTAGAPGGAWAGAALLAAGGLVHLSSLIILTVLVSSLWLVAGRRLRGRPWWLALVLGALPPALYYASFLGLIVDQLPRLLEGSGHAPGSAGFWSSLAAQAQQAVSGWGLPFLALGVLGLPRRLAGDLDRELAAFWLAGGVFLIVAAATPLEVRYLHALSVPLSVACARALIVSWSRGTPGRAFALAITACQVWVSGAWILAILLQRNRP